MCDAINGINVPGSSVLLSVTLYTDLVDLNKVSYWLTDWLIVKKYPISLGLKALSRAWCWSLHQGLDGPEKSRDGQRRRLWAVWVQTWLKWLKLRSVDNSCRTHVEQFVTGPKVRSVFFAITLRRAVCNIVLLFHMRRTCRDTFMTTVLSTRKYTDVSAFTMPAAGHLVPFYWRNFY